MFGEFILGAILCRKVDAKSPKMNKYKNISMLINTLQIVGGNFFIYVFFEDHMFFLKKTSSSGYVGFGK